MVLFEAVNEIKSETISLTMPSIQIKPKEPIEKDEKDKKESNFEVSGLGVFEKDKLVGFMDGDEVKYFLIATNKLKVGPLSIKINLDENSFISSQILKNKTKYKFFEKNNQIYFQVKTDSTVNIVNIATEKPYHDDYELKNLQKMLENNIKQDIEQLIITMQKKFDTDIFGFGDYIYRNDLKLWKKYQDNWDETFKNMKVEVTSKVQINNQGTMSSQIKSEES